MTKKKSFISLVLAFCLIIPAMFLLSACGGNNTQTLKSDDGIAVVGEFEKGAELKTDKVEVSSDDATTIFDKLEGGNIKITTTSNAMIYDIHISKDDKKVQPNGKVAVSVPVTESANGYKVFHIKDDNTIEELSATYKDGILTFETSSFSYFVIVPTGDVLMNIDPDNPTPDTGDDTPTKYTFKASVQEYTGVDDIGTISENDSVVDLTAGREVADGTKITLTATAKEGYALKGWYKVVEGETDTLISCATTYEFNVNENMNIKAVFDEKCMVYFQCEGFAYSSYSIKVKGVESSSDSFAVAKGTEVTIKFTPCEGFVFNYWGRKLFSAYSDTDWTNVSTNNEYTFTVNDSYSFFANALGIPKKITFAPETSQPFFNSGKYVNNNGRIERTIKVGETITAYNYKGSDVKLWVYYANQAETTAVCSYTVDDSRLDTSKVGTYEIIYTYTGWYPAGQDPVTMSIFINVVADTTE